MKSHEKSWFSNLKSWKTMIFKNVMKSHDFGWKSHEKSWILWISGWYYFSIHHIKNKNFLAKERWKFKNFLAKVDWKFKILLLNSSKNSKFSSQRWLKNWNFLAKETEIQNFLAKADWKFEIFMLKRSETWTFSC